MSTQAMTWAITVKAGSPSAKAVLWSIANYANQHWCAFPGQPLIAEESEQSIDSVQRRIRDLEALGVLRRIPLQYQGRKAVDFVVLQPSPLFGAPLSDIEAHLPRGHVIDRKWAEEHAAADCGNAETGTSEATLPQTLPQPAAHAAATVRQQEPSTEPREPLRESARTREGKSERPGSWTFEAPDQTKARSTLDALTLAWRNGAIGGAGAIGDTAKVLAALMDLAEADHEIAIERAPRFLRSGRDAKRSYTMSIATYIANREFDHHPPPAGAEGKDSAVELKPWVKPLYAMLWKALHKARQASGDETMRRRLRDCLQWLEKGLTLPAAAMPSADDVDGLVAIKVDSDACAQWRDWCTRVGVRLPIPDQVPVIWVPAEYPLPLNLAGPTPYRLALPVRIEYRSAAWWWRLHQRIADGSPLVSSFNKIKFDPVNDVRKRQGGEETDYGPIPLAADLAGMTEVRTLTDAWNAWELWFIGKSSDIALWPDNRIWCPSEYPERLRRNEGEAA